MVLNRKYFEGLFQRTSEPAALWRIVFDDASLGEEDLEQDEVCRRTMSLPSVILLR